MSAGIACGQSFAEELARMFARLQSKIRHREHIFLLIQRPVLVRKQKLITRPFLSQETRFQAQIAQIIGNRAHRVDWLKTHLSIDLIGFSVCLWKEHIQRKHIKQTNPKTHKKIEKQCNEHT